MIVALVGSGPCIADVDVDALAKNRTVATLNAMAEDFPTARWAFMQEPQTVALYGHTAGADTTIVFGIETERCLWVGHKWGPPRGIGREEKIYMKWVFDAGLAPAMHAVIRERKSELFFREWYSWAPQAWRKTRHRLSFCPNDVSIVFGLAYLAELDPLPEAIELYGVDLNREIIRRSNGTGTGKDGDSAGRTILSRFANSDEYPVPIINCCPSSALTEDMVKKEARPWTTQ